jgi:murein DD-endopeptidase MepM/ murein hydrolase activator NlpD
VTSGFSLARFHPILQTWRAHRGIDYAAPTGTPVRATGDGVVALAGVAAGYGNVVIVRHAGDYTTLYGHLSRFVPGLKVGARVRQGEAIAFVGATGWATGPHLHYEFRLAGMARDPTTIGLPTAVPIPPEQRAQFVAATRAFLQHFAVARSLPAGALAAAE